MIDPYTAAVLRVERGTYESAPAAVQSAISRHLLPDASGKCDPATVVTDLLLLVDASVNHQGFDGNICRMIEVCIVRIASIAKDVMNCISSQGLLLGVYDPETKKFQPRREDEAILKKKRLRRSNEEVRQENKLLLLENDRSKKSKKGVRSQIALAPSNPNLNLITPSLEEELSLKAPLDMNEGTPALALEVGTICWAQTDHGTSWWPALVIRRSHIPRDIAGELMCSLDAGKTPVYFYFPVGVEDTFGSASAVDGIRPFGYRNHPQFSSHTKWKNEGLREAFLGGVARANEELTKTPSLRLERFCNRAETSTTGEPTTLRDDHVSIGGTIPVFSACIDWTEDIPGIAWHIAGPLELSRHEWLGLEWSTLVITNAANDQGALSLGLFVGFEANAARARLGGGGGDMKVRLRLWVGPEASLQLVFDAEHLFRPECPEDSSEEESYFRIDYGCNDGYRFVKGSSLQGLCVRVEMQLLSE